MDEELIPNVETPEAPAIESPAPDVAAVDAGQEAAPQTMQQAMERAFNRDEKGRFAPKAEEAAAAEAAAAAATPGAAKPAAPAVPGQQPAAKPADDDLLTMPEGLGQKAQERFQRLATTNRELTERTQELDRQVSYVRETFQQHGIQREQFEQAVQFIGAINRGDLQSAQQLLVQQLQHISLLGGLPMPQIDPLSEFPDLRERVQTLQISEQDAIELARHRKGQALLQSRQQAQQQTEQQAAQRRQTYDRAKSDVDAWVKQQAASDIDWPAIEAQLLPELKNLLEGVPPESWLGVLKAQTNVLKRAASTFKASAHAAPAPNPLRPAAAGASMRAPTSMHEAMFGHAPRT